MKTLRLFTLAFAVFCATGSMAPAVIPIDATVGPQYVSTPGDNSGWQYQGQFNAFLGTPIAPYYFMTAQHIGGNIGDTFTFHGQVYTTVAQFADPATDLRIWQVDSSHPFAVYAPLYVEPVDSGGAPIQTEVGQELRVFGRGAARGTAMMLGGTLHGWAWGSTDYVERWGRNTVANIVGIGSAAYPDWFFLQATFDQGAPAGEAHLSVNDSSGGVFVLQNGLWRLAGINYGVDDLYTLSDDGQTYNRFNAAIFDARGYYAADDNNDGGYYLVTGTSNVPTAFYSTQTASRNAWIQGVTNHDPTTLPKESFNNWLTAYFSPSDLANTNVTGPNADPDGDGVTNLTEFAYNLDPTYAEAPVMTAGTGLRGLPLIQVEQVSGSDRRVTVEFVRRTVASGANLSYQVQFTTATGSGAKWQIRGTTVITSINPRWQRVKVTDSVTAGANASNQNARVVLIRRAAIIAAAATDFSID